MKKIILFAALLAAILLVACGPAAGDAVEIQTGAIGCRIWSQPDLGWVNCSQVTSVTPGLVVDHPEGLGHEYQGRVRVQTAAFGPLWFEPRDLERVPEK